MDNKHSNIAIVIGTKAELIKCMPIMMELNKQKKDYYFIHTGQHSLKSICEEFKLKRPDFVLSNAPKMSTKFWSKVNRNSIFWFISIIPKIKDILKKLKPKYVIYHGDTMSTAAASIASSKLLNPEKNWKNVHLEAGLRSGSLFEPFPEEISRQISDMFSNILLAVSERSFGNLKKYQGKKEIFITGNTIVDSSAIAYNKARKKYKKQKYEYVLINIHRHENLKSKERMRKIVEILKNVEIRAIWPLHDNTAHFLEKYGLLNDLKEMKKFKMISLASYSEFIFLLANCKYIITDGGSIQEESLIFKKPCIILRKRTERQEGLNTGINFLTRLNISYSKNIIENIKKGKINVKNFKNPYGKPGISKKILEILR